MIWFIEFVWYDTQRDKSVLRLGNLKKIDLPFGRLIFTTKFIYIEPYLPMICPSLLLPLLLIEIEREKKILFSLYFVKLSY